MVEVFADLLKSDVCCPPLVNVVCEVLSGGCHENAGVFRDCGGIDVLRRLILDKEESGLSIMQQLVLAGGCDEDLAAFLGLLQSADDVVLKTNVINAISGCLRESHRARAGFR